MREFVNEVSAAFSPDGKTLATNSGSVVTLWRIADGMKIRSLSPHKEFKQERSVAFSPDGMTVGVLMSREVWLRDLEGDRPARTLAPPMTPSGEYPRIFAFAFSPDGTRVAVGPWLFSIDAQPFGAVPITALNSASDSITFSPDSTLIATGHLDGNSIEVFRTNDGQLVREFNYGRLTGSFSTSVAAFSPDGRLMAGSGGGGGGGAVKLWRTEDWSEAGTLEGHEEWVGPLGFLPNGTLVSGGEDATVRYWKPETGALLATYSGHTRQIVGAAFSPDGATVATASHDSTIRLWPAAGGPARTIDVGSPARSMAFSAGGLVAAGLENGRVVLHRPEAPAEPPLTLFHEQPVLSVGFSADGGRLVSAAGSQVTIWDVQAGAYLRTFYHAGGVRAVVFSPDGTLVASAGGNQEVRLWTADAGGEETPPLRVLSARNGDNPYASPRTLRFSPDGATLAAIDGAGEMVRLWRVSDGATGWALPEQPTNNFEASGLGFAPDGALLAHAGEGYTVKVRRACNGDVLSALPTEPAASVLDLVFSADGRTLAGAANLSVRLWCAP